MSRRDRGRRPGRGGNGLRLAAAAVLLALAPAAPAHEGHERGGGAGSRDRVAFHQRAVERDPGNWAALAQLGLALLAQARAEGSPEPLGDSERCLGRALELGPGLDALLGLSALANHRHRFAEGEAWARRALAADPRNPEATALLVESLLALGEPGRAAAELGRAGDEKASFHLAAAGGQWRLATAHPVEAAESFRRAAALALGAGHPDLAAWARVEAAAALRGAGELDAAERELAAAGPAAGDRVALERAACLAARGEARAALRLVDDVPGERLPAATHALAFTLARRVGDDRLARRHFLAAERALSAPLASGEAYTLEALARLWLEAGVLAESALALAEENLAWKRDAPAWDVWRCARERVAESAESATRQ